MKDKPTQPTNDDPRNESGRISRSGTQAGISIGNKSTSGGEGPIPPGGTAKSGKPKSGTPNADKPDNKHR